MNKIVRIAAMLAALLLLFGASAQELPGDLAAVVPAGAVVRDVLQENDAQIYTLSIPETGEELRLTARPDGTALRLETTVAALNPDGGQSVERSRAEEVAAAQYPQCSVLYARDGESGKELGVAAEDFCGSVEVASDRILARVLEFGEIIRDGRLTLEGAKKVLSLHRPDAQLLELELDEDDGVYVYEGEALLGGEEYEFEIHASTGKMLEWERD